MKNKTNKEADSMTQKKTNHTPGPWYIADKDTAAMLNSTWAVYAENEDGSKTVVANVWQTDSTVLHTKHDATTEANAWLIAAAPTMLEALYELYKTSDVLDRYQIIRKAIHLATGQDPE